MGRMVKTRRRYRPIAAVLLAVFAAGSMRADGLQMFVGSAAAQIVQPRDFIVDSKKFLDSCPPGHRIRFQREETSLNVDPHWLDTYSLFQLAERFRNQCPIEPVQSGQGLINPLFFNRSIIAAAQINPTTLGGSYFGLRIAFIPPREDKPFLGMSREPVQQPSVFEITPALPDAGKSQPPSKIYDLHYPDDGMGSSTTVRLSCNGGGPETDGKRACFTVTSFDTPYRYRGVLSVYYMVQQAYSPASQKPANSELAEPELWLAFDTRIRAWIDSMMGKP